MSFWRFDVFCVLVGGRGERPDRGLQSSSERLTIARTEGLHNVHIYHILISIAHQARTAYGTRYGVRSIRQ